MNGIALIQYLLYKGGDNMGCRIVKIIPRPISVKRPYTNTLHIALSVVIFDQLLTHPLCPTISFVGWFGRTTVSFRFGGGYFCIMRIYTSGAYLDKPLYITFISGAQGHLLKEHICLEHLFVVGLVIFDTCHL